MQSLHLCAPLHCRMFVVGLVGSGWTGLEAKSVIGRLVCWQVLKVSSSSSSFSSCSSFPSSCQMEIHVNSRRLQKASRNDLGCMMKNTTVTITYSQHLWKEMCKIHTAAKLLNISNIFLVHLLLFPKKYTTGWKIRLPAEVGCQLLLLI